MMTRKLVILKQTAVTLTTRDGRQYTGSRLVSTIPLNVLNTVTFDPPLDAQRAAAMGIGHMNQCVKVHAEVSNKDMRSWTGISYPFNRLSRTQLATAPHRRETRTLSASVASSTTSNLKKTSTKPRKRLRIWPLVRWISSDWYAI